MPFIGQQPLTGAYSKLDAITTSATATYNLLLNGGAYSPDSANHLLVSLNGVMQAPQDSFTVSGSTIIFDSALTSSDNIDFIMALGDVLNIGTPSDGTVTAGKIATNAVTDAKIAGMAASKLTGALPAISGAALTGINIASGTCSFQTDIASTQNISGTTWTLLNFTVEETDPDNCYNTTTKQFTAPSSGNYYFFSRINISGFTNKVDAVYMRFYVNNSQPSGDATETLQQGYSVGGGNDWFNAQVSGILALSAGDTVDARVYTSTGSRNIRAAGSGFGGFRLT